jgi:hypothetical protein
METFQIKSEDLLIKNDEKPNEPRSPTLLAEPVIRRQWSVNFFLSRLTYGSPNKRSPIT